MELLNILKNDLAINFIGLKVHELFLNDSQTCAKQLLLMSKLRKKELITEKTLKFKITKNLERDSFQAKF